MRKMFGEAPANDGQRNDGTRKRDRTDEEPMPTKYTPFNEAICGYDEDEILLINNDFNDDFIERLLGDDSPEDFINSDDTMKTKDFLLEPNSPEYPFVLSPAEQTVPSPSNYVAASPLCSSEYEGSVVEENSPSPYQLHDEASLLFDDIAKVLAQDWTSESTGTVQMAGGVSSFQQEQNWAQLAENNTQQQQMNQSQNQSPVKQLNWAELPQNQPYSKQQTWAQLSPIPAAQLNQSPLQQHNWAHPQLLQNQSPLPHSQSQLPQNQPQLQLNESLMFQNLSPMQKQNLPPNQTQLQQLNQSPLQQLNQTRPQFNQSQLPQNQSPLPQNQSPLPQNQYPLQQMNQSQLNQSLPQVNQSLPQVNQSLPQLNQSQPQLNQSLLPQNQAQLQQSNQSLLPQTQSQQLNQARLQLSPVVQTVSPEQLQQQQIKLLQQQVPLLQQEIQMLQYQMNQLPEQQQQPLRQKLNAAFQTYQQLQRDLSSKRQIQAQVTSTATRGNKLEEKIKVEIKKCVPIQPRPVTVVVPPAVMTGTGLTPASPNSPSSLAASRVVLSPCSVTTTRQSYPRKSQPFVPDSFMSVQAPPYCTSLVCLQSKLHISFSLR